MSATVKAFMSRPGEGPFFLDGDVLASADGRTFANHGPRDDRFAASWALNEAGAILAATEPGIIEAFGLRVSIEPADVALAQLCRVKVCGAACEPCAALAKSLARFIEEPIQ